MGLINNSQHNQIKHLFEYLLKYMYNLIAMHLTYHRTNLLEEFLS